jgi:hypothetical protein
LQEVYFQIEYLARMDSIEGAYIGISRYLLDHGRQVGWFRLWYEGIPQQNSYPPLLHTLVAAFAWMVHISPALAHHQVCAALYCLGPVTVFFSQAVWQEIGDWAWPPASLIL